ncbi:MAG: response regulator [Nitrospinota bacterium]
MHTYVLISENYPPDAGLLGGLKKRHLHTEKIDMPEDHEKMINLFSKRDAGIVFIPPVWEDLFCVKLIDEIQTLKVPYEVIIVGGKPSIPNLIVAFNNGLSSYIETPIDDDKLGHAVSRAASKLRKKAEEQRIKVRLSEFESGFAPNYHSPLQAERDQILARAFLDFMHQRGPIHNGEVHILVVSSSEAQEHKLENFLNNLGIKIQTASDIASAVQLATSNNYTLIISDGVLPDGDATELINKLRKTLKEQIPRFLVWSSSPDRVPALLNPDNHIDDVLIKPGPGAGIEAVLPSIVNGIYQTRL